MAWITKADLKSRYSYSLLSDDEWEELLHAAKQDVFDYCFVSMHRKLRCNDDNVIKLPLNNLFVADSFSFDGTVTKADINIYQLDVATKTEEDLSSHVTSFNSKYGYVIMDDYYPTENKEVHVEYYLGRFEWTKMYARIRRLFQLFFFQELLNFKPMAAATVMADVLNLNNVDFNPSASIEEKYNLLQNMIDTLVMRLQPVNLQSRDIVPTDMPYPFRFF